MPGFKISNEYAEALGDLYEKTPKAVFAAMAVSFFTTGGDHMEDLIDRFHDEWVALYNSGIVPQKPLIKGINLNVK